MTKEQLDLAQAEAMWFQTMSETQGWKLFVQIIDRNIKEMMDGLTKVSPLDPVAITDLQSRIDVMRRMRDTPEEYQQSLKDAQEQFAAEELDRQFELPERT